MHNKVHGELYICTLLVCYRLTCLDGENKKIKPCNTSKNSHHLVIYSGSAGGCSYCTSWLHVH